MPTTPDTPAALEFLRGLEPAGPWLLVAINPDPGPNDRKSNHAEFSPSTEPALLAWIDQHQGRWNVYYTSNLPQVDPFTTSKKEAVRFLRLLHVDVDLPGPADDLELSNALLTQLRALIPRPTAIIFTGGGYQGLWVFLKKLRAEEDTTRVEAANTTIWKLLRGDPCHDVSRLLRLPGTINVPNPKKRLRGRVPGLAYVVEADWSRTYSLDDDPLPSLPSDFEPLPLQASSPNGQEIGLLASLPASLRKLIVSGDPSDFKNDRSRLGWAIMCRLLRRGWSDDDVTKVFLDPKNGVSSHYLDQPQPAAYVSRNLARAKDAVALDWKRDQKTGLILIKDQENVDKALAQLGVKLSHDALADRVWVNGTGPAQRLTDEGADAIWLRVQAECGFLPDQAFFKTVFTVRARERSFHPVLDYLKHVQPSWDQRERIGSATSPSWLTRYGGVEDTPLTRAVGRLTLVAAVRRMRSPGCKFDEMLMLVDPTQGTNKSSAIRLLAVNEDWFNDYLPIGEVGREVIEHVRGFWIIEAQELAGMSTRDVERIKGFCSRQTDRGRMSYHHFVTDLPRSCVFIGTTNEESIFTDISNRRYWPVRILVEFDLDAMRRDLAQLWAEAACAEAAGESIRLARELWPAAAEAQASFKTEDQWSSLLDHTLGNLNGRLMSLDAFKIINKGSGVTLHADGRRLGRAMREIGFERRQIRDGHSPNPRWYYVRGTLDDQQLSIYVFRDPITGVLEVGHSPPTTDVVPADDLPF